MRVLAIVLIMTVVGLTGCFGDDGGNGDDPTTSPSPTASPSPSPSPDPTEEPARDPVTWTVIIEDVAFKDSPATIQVGDTIEWVHRDGTTMHRVETRDGAPESFDSGDMTEATNSGFSFTFETVGDYEVFCRYHEGAMSESLEVRESFAGTPDGNGTEGEPRDPVTWEVTIAGSAFVDGSITVQQGDTVRWVHQDGQTPHTVTADDGTFDSGPVYMVETPGADTYEYTFDAVGAFDYHCEVHPSMTGTITVEA